MGYAKKRVWLLRDLRPNKLLRLLAGQPHIDVRASINSFIPKDLDDNLAERLINFYSRWLIDNPDLHDKLEFEVLRSLTKLLILRSGKIDYMLRYFY